MAEDPKGKKYRRPDGSTYYQYGGPKSRQDVEVPEDKPTPSPAPKPTAAPSTRQTASAPPRTSADVTARRAQEAADEAAKRAKATETFAPWMGEKPKQQEGGLGGAAARQAQKRSDMPAEKAGDAIAASRSEESDRMIEEMASLGERPKKKKSGGY